MARNDLVEEKFRNDLNLPLDEFWNSSYMKDRREKMLSGTPPKECELCIHSNRNDLYKDHFNRLYQDRFSSSAVTFSPVDLDIRVPICNFKCRICNPEYSTAIASMYQKNRPLLEEAGIHVPVENRELRLRTNESFTRYIESQKIEKVYFAGGEPTAVPDHLELLRRLRKNNPDVVVSYNSNLSMKKDFLEEWVTVLKEFKAVNVQCSLDGVGELGEYLREGLVFSQFSDNIDYLKKNTDHRLFLSLDLTLTSLGVMNIKDFCEYALAKDLKVFCKFMVGGPATFLRCEFLKPDERKSMTDSFNTYFHSLDDHQKNLLENLYYLIQKLPELPSFSPDELHDASKKIVVFDSLYGHRKSFQNFFITKDS